jgi:hypothetical protein
VDLVDEQHLLGLEIDQQAHDVARALQRRGAGDPAAHPQLFGQHQGHGGLAQARRTMQEHVVQGLAAAAGGLHGNAQHLLELPLADVVGQAAGSQTVFPGRFAQRRLAWLFGPDTTDTIGRSGPCGILALPPWIHQSRSRRAAGRNAGAGSSGRFLRRPAARGDDRHGSRVPSAA